VPKSLVSRQPVSAFQLSASLLVLPPPTSSLITSSSSLQPIKSEDLTIGGIKVWWDSIEAAISNSNEEKKDKAQRVLWYAVIQNGNIEVVKYLLDLLSPATPDEEVTSSTPITQGPGRNTGTTSAATTTTGSSK
jgi:hypothetical protein